MSFPDPLYRKLRGIIHEILAVKRSHEKRNRRTKTDVWRDQSEEHSCVLKMREGGAVKE
jgi:hypothetical protein